MTITIDFSLIFSLIGIGVCAIVALWIIGWIIWGIRGMGEFLGIWDAIGTGIRNRVSWVKSKFKE